MEEPKSERFFSIKSPEGPWDYIVVGSGMGGMTTAALLSRLGYRVLVLEQHYVPGGFTHTFKRKHWVWDVGVHAVGEVDSRAVIGRILHQLTDGKLEWATLGSVYDEFWFPDLRVDFPDNKRAFVDALNQAFPDSGAAIDAYLNQVREVGTSMRSYYLSRLLPPGWAPLTDSLIARTAYQQLTRTTREVLNGITPDPRLQAVLTAQWGYYGSPPARSSFAIHALVAKHFWHGGYYPVGGAARIAQCLLGSVAGAGGWTRVRAEVSQVLVHNGRAAGVRLSTGEEILSRRVVSAIGALPTVQRILPDEVKAASWARSIDRLRPSPCHVCLYIGFKGDIREAGAGAANKWFYDTWASDSDAWNLEDPNEVPPVLYCSFPSLKDPHHDPGPELYHTGEIVTFVPYDFFSPWKEGKWKRRGEDYDALKARITDRLLEKFFQHLPGLKSMVAFTELSTPLSTEHFTRAAGGAIYGIEPTPERYQTRSLRPRTGLPDFFLSGSDMATVGVMGAMVGGLLSAIAAEPRKGYAFLKEASRR